MANRYSQILTSQFDPLSLQEVLTVPLYKQKLYDQLEADRIATQEAFKVDPLDVHKDEARQLQNDFNTKADELARYQLKTGDLQGAKTKMLDLRKEYKKLTDPTGKVNLINSAKQAKAEAYKQWMATEEAKKYGPEVANARWNEFSSNKSYSGYDDKGNITNINQMQAPKYENLQEDIKDLKGLIGSTELTTAINNGFNMFPQSDGSIVIKDGSGNKIVQTNDKQLINAYSYLKEKWLTPTGEGFKSAQFAGQTPQSIFNKLNSGIGMMREYSEKDDRNDNFSIQGYTNPNTIKKEETFKGDAYNLGEGKLFETNQKLLKELGLSSTGIEGFTKEERDQQSPFNAPLFKISSVKKSTTKSQEYKNLASSINRTLPQNQKFKEGSEQEEKAVKNYLNKYGNTIIKNRVIDPFVDPTGLLFADKTIGKEKNAAQRNLWDRIKIKASKIVDENGKEIPLAQVTEFTYNGDLTPESNINVFKEDTRQNYLAHTGTVKIGKGKDAEIKTVYISRNSDDFNTPQYKGGVDKNKINNITVSQPNIYHHFKSSEIKGFGSNDMKDVEIKYNENKGSYDISYKHPKDGNVDFSLTTDETGDAETKFNKWLIKLNN